MMSRIVLSALSALSALDALPVLSVFSMMSLLFGSLSPLPAGTPVKRVSDVKGAATPAAVHVGAPPGVGDGRDQQGGDDERDDERDDRVPGAEDRGGDEAADDRADDAENDREDDADAVPAGDQQGGQATDHQPDEEPYNNGGQCNCHAASATRAKPAYSASAAESLGGRGRKWGGGEQAAFVQDEMRRPARWRPGGPSRVVAAQAAG